MDFINQVANGQAEADLSLPVIYPRTTGAATESGTSNEYKMALLTYLRAQRWTKKFWLGVNGEGVGAFDDIILIYEYDNKKYQLLWQLKHKDDPNFTIQRNALKDAKGPFSLNKYFESVQAKLIEGDHFDNTQFVLFTNASVNVKLSCGDEMNPLVKEFISTAGYVGEVYTVKASSDLCDSFKRNPGANYFIKKLVISCKQASVKELEDLIKHEILLHFRRVFPHSLSVYDTLLCEIKKWWELKGVTNYLTESWEEWKHLAPGSSLLDYIKFNDNDVVTLIELVGNMRVHLMYPNADAQLRSLKVLQALQMKENCRFFFTKISDLPGSKAMEMWKKGWFDILVIDTYLDSETTEDVHKLLEDLINLKLEDGGKGLVLLSDGNLCTQSSEVEWLCEQDICILNQLNEESRNCVDERLQSLSLRENRILLRDTTGELLSTFLLIEGGSRSLLADINGNTPLLLAVADQNEDMVELLLQLKSDVAAADVVGDTALIISCRKPSTRIAELILDYGGLTTAADVVGDTPLIIAVRNENTNTVKLLLEHNAATTAADKDGCTPLLIASSKGNSEIVNLLLQHGASTRAADLDGSSSLHLAVKSNDIKSVRLLLENGARTMAADINGDTPLLIAVKEGFTEIVDLLLQNNASPMAVTYEGDTPLHIAVKKRYPAIAQLLLNCKASTTAMDRNGLTPLELAQKGGFMELVALLS